MKYYSKKDWWVLPIISIAILFPLSFGLCAIHIESERGMVIGGWISLICAVSLALALACLSFPLYYQITSDVLRIRCGVLQQEIPLAAIQDVFPTHNPLTAPAWSLDRLQINYQVGARPRYALIAPQNKAQFLLDLAYNNSGLEVHTDSLHRCRERFS